MTRILLAMLLLATGIHSMAAPQPAKNNTLAEFGDAVVLAINERDPKAMLACVDGPELGRRVSRLLEFQPSSEKAFLESFLGRGLPSAIESMMQLIESTNGTARYMHATNSDPAQVLVRIDMGGSGFEYLEFLVQREGGKTRAVDWYRLSSGELVSQTMASTAQLFVTQNRDVVQRLLGIRQVDNASMKILQKYGELHRQGDYGAALDRLNELPENIADSRVMLTMRAQVASLADRTVDYDRLLARLAEKYADDPSTAFLLIDHYVNTNDTKKLLDAVGVIEQRVGRDGVTEQVRATAWFLQDDYTAALRHLDESVRLEPDRADAQDIRATLLVRLGRHGDAVAQYREMEQRFGIKFTRQVFIDDETWAEFVKSAAFAEWLPE